ncbi:alanine racemase [Gordonia hydrophobica]|uniref:Alanine racemase n=1 Tax=Gordonia hydrophobica TaxID=40516 RepID=A0ABZ2U508_9ACTN|nr:alanine racemase [Gordonia hydrophobica]MBM7366742.1 D-serine deaminase-like pyridoxal phosphate-dependent protein [Gordonia hydrophobica]
MPDTPYLFVDVDRLERNLQSLARWAAEHDVVLRPHAKTHKCAQIAQRQLAVGAVGLTVATIGEAEAFADAGVTDLFIAYPLWLSGGKAHRLRDLADRVTMSVGVDSIGGARRLAEGLAGAPVQVLAEVDSGMHRSGVDADHVAEIAIAARDAGLDVAGVFTFPGHGYGPGTARDAAAQEAAALSAASKALRDHGFDAPVVSGGSTPTVRLADPGVVTELRPGVYAFYDAQQVELGSASVEDVALTAVATVVSVSGERIVLDAGSKILGADRPAWTTGFGRLADHLDARIVSLSEHHAVVDFLAGSRTPELGDVVRVIPNHVCSAVNLVDELYAGTTPGDDTEPWPVIARGANA